MNTLIIKIITPLIVIAVLGYFGYVLFIQPPVSSDTASMVATSTTGSGIDLVNTINQLKNSLKDQSLFSSEIFLGLKDFNLALLPEPQGRANPFAPIGMDNVLQTTQTKSTSTNTR